MLNIETIKNTVICADCLDILKQLPDKCVDLILTDPPYGIGVQSKNCVASRMDKRSDKKIEWDKIRPMKEYFDEIKRISKKRIIFGANYFNCFEEGGAIVWDKLQPLPDSSQCEIASVSGYKKVFKYTQRWTNFVNTKVSGHPTEKPLEFMNWILKRFTKENDLILDCFAGSGTTGVAAKALHRNFILIEKEPKYVEICNQRLRQGILI